MIAKIILFLIICAGCLALLSGLKKIFRIFSSKGGCGCSKTGSDVCHCHDHDEQK